MINDNSSLDVIQNTSDWKKDFVRLYHRPKTPTQYHNEGLRSTSNLSHLKAHCPFPVFFLFNSEAILSKNDTIFTGKSLALREDIDYYSTPEEYEQLPFDKIFHEGSFLPDQKDDIIQHRHAEILIPKELIIDDYLEFILVRSLNEKNTLLNQLSHVSREKYQSLIRIDRQSNFFFGYWTYIDELLLRSDYLSIKVNVGLGKPTFDLTIEITNLRTMKVSVKTIVNWQCEPNLTLKFINSLTNYSAKVFLDEKLLAHDFYQETDRFELPY